MCFMRKFGLTNDQLKILAMVTMTIDHIGMLLFPRVLWFRIIGRLAFPIYAFMIAEGCRHTRSLSRYLGGMAAMAALCQIVSFVVTRSLTQCVLVTFSLSICLIILLKQAREKNTPWAKAAFGAGVAAVLVITELLPKLLPGFQVEYDFVGVALPVCVYGVIGKRRQLAAAAACLCLLGLAVGTLQWFALLSLPLLALYNGQRGKWGIKWLFYLYYPAHLAVLWLIAAIF